MALTKTPIELSSTPGIVDNSNATAITIGSDESTTFSGPIQLTAGALAGAGNAGFSHRSADNKVYLQAGTGGFNILDDQQNTHFSIDSAGVSSFNNNVNIGGVGNISPYGIRFAINGTGSGGAGLYFGSGVIIPTDNTPTITDANVDLGASNYRFKALYLKTVDGTAAINTTVNSSINYNAASFTNSAGTQVGRILANNAGTTQYITSSDARLKDNIANATDAGELIDTIQVRQFDWKSDGSHQAYGMIAQELQTIAPDAVAGDPDSEEVMGVDYSKLVPMLVKEIQSLRTRVQTLENN